MEEHEHRVEVASSRAEVRPVGPADFQPTRKRPCHERTDEDLHVCPACESQLVHPVDWAPAARRRWLVELRCPECEWIGGGVYSQKAVDRLDEALDAGVDDLLADLTRLSRANMEEHVEAFIAALRDDRILPEDF